MTFYRRVGELILGTRLKRISDKFLMDVAKIYKKLKIPFEVSWFPIFYLLNEKGKLSVTEIANELEITHSAVSQMITVIDKKGLINFIDDKDDKRRRFICFTEEGRKLMTTLPPIWKALQHSMQDMFSEGVNSLHILSVLDEMEDSISKESLFSRTIKEIEKGEIGDIVIEDYSGSYYNSYKNFVLEWLIENNETEIEKVDLINKPHEAVNQQDCFILVALVDKECVGIITSQKLSDTEGEIIFFVIHEERRKHQIGKELLSSLIEKLISLGIKKVTITISRNYSERIKILKDTGFVLHTFNNKEVSFKKSASLVMEYII